MLPSRVLPKIPVVTSKDRFALQNKVIGYHVTEGNTPLVGPYLRAIARVVGFDLTKGFIGPIERVGKDLVWKLKSGPTPYDEARDKEGFRYLVMSDCKLLSHELDAIESRLNTATTFADIETIRLEFPVEKPSVPIVQY